MPEGGADHFLKRVLASLRQIRHDNAHFLPPRNDSEDFFMGTGRTLNKDPRTRPIKSPSEKRRRSAAQRKRLVKLGMDEAVVAKMQTEDVRKLVQRPVQVKKSVAALAKA